MASSTSEQQKERTVHLVGSFAPLLSGDLHSCHNATDPSCSGGVAAVRAYLRGYQGDDPALLIQRFDKNDPFVHMHPLRWSVNRLVLNTLMGINVFVSSPALLLQNSADYDVSQRDLSLLQSNEIPMLLTNVGVTPGSTWHPYVKAVHFDKDTGLAVLSIWNSGETLNVPQLDAAVATLNYISKLNEELGCKEVSPLFQQYFVNRTGSATNGPVGAARCWVPVVFYMDVAENFESFLAAIVEYENPPALIMRLDGDIDEYSTPVQVGSRGTWVISYEMKDDEYFHHVLKISSDGLSIDEMELITHGLDPLPEEFKDEMYATEILALRKLADEAEKSNPVVGYSQKMPLARVAEEYRPCKAGECPIGNLFSDAFRWKADADFGFTTSGGLRGPGWEAGEVTVANIFESLPFPNTVCTGVVSGVSLFRLLNYSTAVATFEGQDTKDGGRLVQVAGLRVTYNTQLQDSRLVALEVWNTTEETYSPVERLRYYKFATDSFSCSGYPPFPALLGDDLVMEGEQPGKIGHDLVQDVVAEFLGQYSAENPYNTTTKGRLVNNTRISRALNFVQTEEDCIPGTYWMETLLSCLNCPADVDVKFTESFLSFEGDSGSTMSLEGIIYLHNNEEMPVVVLPKSIPDWVRFASFAPSAGSNEATTLTVMPKESKELKFVVDPSALEAGTARATVAFGVLDGGSHPGCVGRDATFDVFMRVMPGRQMNQLGEIRIAGFVLTAVVVFTSLFFAGFVIWNRELRIVKTMQPVFLTTICFGILVLGTAIIPLSIDDEIASDNACGKACMATPWLLSMGFTLAMSALFSKLWRINKLFHSQVFQRIQVREKHVIAPFAIMFTLNFIFLLTWTIEDPLTWERLGLEGANWNTYGTCVSGGPVSLAMLILVSAINLLALVLAVYQAYRARNISDEFSESRNLGIALFSWVQILVVGLPVMFLIESDNPTAKYFLQIVLIFAFCMSMLLILFVPIFVHYRRLGKCPAYSKRASVEPRSELGSGQLSTSFKNSKKFGRGGVVVSGMPSADGLTSLDAFAPAREVMVSYSRSEEESKEFATALSGSSETSKQPKFSKKGVGEDPESREAADPEPECSLSSESRERDRELM